MHVRGESGTPLRLVAPRVEAALCAAAALCALAAGTFIAAHYPRMPAIAVTLFLAWTGAILWRPSLWLVALPALLPVVGFAPWTGWLTFEEWDLLALGAATGGYASTALRRSLPAPTRVPLLGGAAVTLLALFAASTVLALYRGLVDAGPVELAWSQGYYESLNSVRVFKSFALAALLSPLLAVELQRSSAVTLRRLMTGLALGCGAASAAVLWERAAFPGVLNFSTDYRATGSFWEMHVGGAALDGFLAITFPSTVWLLLRAARPLHLVAAAALVGLGAYAGLATFSRGVYVALPVSIALLALLVSAHRTRMPLLDNTGTLIRGAALALFGAALCFVVFRSGGYRALGAALGALAIAVPLAHVAPRPAAREWVIALALGTVLGVLSLGVGYLVYKGPYVMYAALWFLAAALLLRQRRSGDARLTPLVLGSFVALLIAAAIVALHWGGENALEDSAIALALLLAFAMWSTGADAPIVPAGWRAQTLVIGSAVLVAGIVTVFAAGAYMGERFSTGASDFAGRVKHWRDGVGMLQGPSGWILGEGLGRFPARYFFHVRDRVFPGSYAIEEQNGRKVLRLSGPRYPASFGDLFRVSQRVPARPGAYVAFLDVRATRPVNLHVEVCAKHLLYADGCAIREIPIKSDPQAWQRLTVPLDGRRITGGAWYAPQLAFFSLAVESSAESVDIDEVSVVGPDGRELIDNGDFADGMEHWFFTSDRYHLPWHIKSLPLNVLFEQGLIGLALFALLVVMVLWRLAVGRAAAHPAAPYLAAAVAGFLVVGLFDSLTDVPRVAFVFYLLSMAALMLRDGADAAATNTRR
jgi:hypothetical protein